MQPDPRYKTDPIKWSMYKNDNSFGAWPRYAGIPTYLDAPKASRITLFKYRTKRNWVKYLLVWCGL